VGALLAAIVLGLAIGTGSARAANLGQPPFATGLTPAGLILALGSAMVGALFSADAWANVTFAAGEVRDARRTVPRALVLGTGLVCLLYLITNVAYLNVLPLVGTADGPDALARGIQHAPADRVGAAAMERLAGGSLGATLMALAVMLSTFGCANGLVLGGERPRGAGYPWLQVAYLTLVAALVVDLLITKPAYTWRSVAVVASGLPFYALWGRGAAA